MSPDDDEALLAALRVLADCPDHLQQLSRRALERAARYTPRAMAEQTLAVYQQTLAQQAVPA